MNDNESPSNVIDLMATAQATAVILPDGVHDVLILGFNADGTLCFNSEASLDKIALLLTLAQHKVVECHYEDVEPDDDEPPPPPLRSA